MGSKKKREETSSSEDDSGRSAQRNRSTKKDHKKARDESRDVRQADSSASRADRNYPSRDDRPRKRPHSPAPAAEVTDHHRGGRMDNRKERDDRRHRDRNPDRRERRDDNRDFRNRRGDRNRDNFHRRRRGRSGSFDHANAKWGRGDDNKTEDKNKEPAEKQKPNFGLSGKLTEETNTFKGVVIKYSEPPEARKPKRRWRLYPFKGDKALQTLYIHRESAYLIGRDRKVVDLPVDHPSCSKQHAALQYRLVPFTREDGSAGKRVRPYLIDLESANGTFINNKKIDAKKYVELLERDVVKFGFSSREYVLLHENSKDEAQDDDVKQEEEEEVKVKQETN